MLKISVAFKARVNIIKVCRPNFFEKDYLHLGKKKKKGVTHYLTTISCCRNLENQNSQNPADQKWFIWSNLLEMTRMQVHTFWGAAP